MWSLESEILKKRSEHLRFREPHCHSAPPPLTFWVCLHLDFSDGLCKMIFSTAVCFGRSRSSRVVAFGTKQKRICDLVCHSNLGLFRDIAGFCAHDLTPILP